MRRLKPGQTSARLRCDRALLHGTLELPADAAGVVILTYPTALAERGAVDRRLVNRFADNSLGTFSVGLLGAAESPLDVYSQRLDLAVLAARVRAASDWLREYLGSARLPVGYFSSGLASAPTMIAAAEQPMDVSAIVSRGGRPDLAGPALRFVAAPTLFIVGSEAETLLAANQLAFDQLPGTKSVEIILGAGAELTEADATPLVVESAAGWLSEHLCAAEVR